MNSEQALKKLTGLSGKHPAATDIDKTSFQRFAQAYAILEETCYIPEKRRMAFKKFVLQLPFSKSDLPTAVHVLQNKIYLDDKLDSMTEKIYSVLNLSDT